MDTYDALQRKVDSLLSGDPLPAAPAPTAVSLPLPPPPTYTPATFDLDAALAAPIVPAKAEPVPVRPSAARQRQNDPRLMAWEAFKAAHPWGGQTVAERMHYAVLSRRATRARALLVKYPEMVAWYAQREMLASMGRDPAGAGPSPISNAGKRAAAAREKAKAEAQEREHVYLMTCELPDPYFVRPGERSPEAAQERYAAEAERRRIESYRAKQGKKEAATQQYVAAVASPDTSPDHRRLARMRTPWQVRVSEDELHMAMSELAVRCHKHTQLLPMIRRRHRPTA